MCSDGTHTVKEYLTLRLNVSLMLASDLKDKQVDLLVA